MSEPRYAPLTAFDLPAFAELTFPTYRTLMTHPEAPVVAVGVVLDDQPIGLALARAGGADDEEGTAELLSLFVALSQRGKGIGTKLLSHLEGVLAAEGVTMARASYVAGKPTIPALERILAKLGWFPPTPRMLVFGAELKRLGEAPWLQKAEFDEDDEVLPWLSLDPSMIKALERELERTPWAPPDLLPAVHLAELEPETSLALVRDGKIAGWTLNHKISDTLLRFSAGWARPEIQRRGRLLALYSASGRRGLSHGFTHATWTVPLHHGPKAAFAQRWMAPYATRADESRGTAKWLGPGGLVPQEDDE